MTDKYKQQLILTGINLENALDRFMGSEALYEKFLRKFLQDKTYRHLTESISSGDANQAFLYAHTMKGLAANLEMESLLEVLTPMTEQLRNGNMENISEKEEVLKGRYAELCNLIKEIE